MAERPGLEGNKAVATSRRPRTPSSAGLDFRVEAHRYGGREWPVLVWSPRASFRAISTSALGGGLGERSWVLNAQVPPSYARRDPEEHLRQVASMVGLGHGVGVGMLTAADLRSAAHTTHGGVQVCATVGVDMVVPAADRTARAVRRRTPGTINIVVLVPRPMTDAALVNSVATATEAKAQALAEAGFGGTGTPTDAICVCCPSARRDAEVRFGGPRSAWGSRVALAVHEAVEEGAHSWRAR